jgi:hypothetical protein
VYRAKASRLSCLLVCASIFTLQESQAALPPVPALQNMGRLEPAAAFGYGLTTKFLSKKAGSGAISLIAKMDDKIFDYEPSSSQESSLGKHIKMLASIDLAIVLWTAAAAAYTQMAVITPGTLRDKRFTLAHQSGLDTLHLIETIGDAFTAYKAINAPAALPVPVAGQNATCTLDPETERELQEYAAQTASQGSSKAALISSLTAGLIASYLSWGWGAQIAQRMTEDPLFSTLIIYDVGITLTTLLKSGFFGVADYFEVYKKCRGCKEIFNLGDDLAYVITGVLPGYLALMRNRHAKTA